MGTTSASVGCECVCGCSCSGAGPGSYVGNVSAALGVGAVAVAMTGAGRIGAGAGAGAADGGTTKRVSRGIIARGAVALTGTMIVSAGRGPVLVGRQAPSRHELPGGHTTPMHETSRQAPSTHESGGGQTTPPQGFGFGTHAPLSQCMLGGQTTPPHGSTTLRGTMMGWGEAGAALRSSCLVAPSRRIRTSPSYRERPRSSRLLGRPSPADSATQCESRPPRTLRASRRSR